MLALAAGAVFAQAQGEKESRCVSALVEKQECSQDNPAEEEQDTQEETQEAKSKQEKNAALGLFSGLYFMQDEVFEEIYGKSSFSMGLEYSFLLPVEAIKSLDVYFGFRYLSDKGKTSFLEEEVKLRIVFFSLAVRYLADLDRFHPFIGPGLDYVVYKETYPADFPVESSEGSMLGFHIQGGTYIDIFDSLAGKVYFKYNFAKTTKEDVKVNLGGVEWGVGLVFRFDL